MGRKVNSTGCTPFLHVVKMNYQNTHQMVIVGRRNGSLFVLFGIRDVGSHVLQLFELCVSPCADSFRVMSSAAVVSYDCWIFVLISKRK